MAEDSEKKSRLQSTHLLKSSLASFPFLFLKTKEAQEILSGQFSPTKLMTVVKESLFIARNKLINGFTQTMRLFSTMLKKL